MKTRNLRTLIVTAASVALALGVVAPANAADTSSVAGGTWVHGFSGHYVVSNYYNGQKWQHRSSVTTSESYSTSDWMGQQEWSYACLLQSLNSNKANYDYR